MGSTGQSNGLSNTDFELEGIILALETAIHLKVSDRHILLFTDSLKHTIWDMAPWIGSLERLDSPVERAGAALRQLKNSGCSVDLYWLAKNDLVSGSLLAHQTARLAAFHAKPGVDRILSPEALNDRELKTAVEEAIEYAASSDIG